MRSPPGSSERRLGVLATQVTKPLRPATRAQDRLPACLRPEFVSAGGLDAFDTVLVANRGEIAIRIFRAATDLGLKTVAVYSSDDALALHTKAADVAVALDGDGVPPYLDIEGVIAAAKQSGANAIHPGYGLLSENSEFAHRCGEEGIVWIGPPVEMLELFGDKSAAREAAASADVPVPRGIDRAISLEECHDFFASVADDGGIMIKAIAGAGGRGSRKVTAAEDVAEAFAACQNEATIAFGNGELYVEEYVTNARHIEVQILADQYGGVCELGERECSVQRKFQKIVEIAPAAHLDPSMRKQIIDASVRLAKKVGYSIIGTMEFLVQSDRFVFIEANARLQVEHTVTEEVTGVDICSSQIQLAAGATLTELGLDVEGVGVPRGRAIQARVNMETLMADGSVRPSGGVLSAYDPPGGPGVRVDGMGYTGYETSPSFDSLIAKVIVHTPSSDFEVAAARTSRALSEFKIGGVSTNIPFLQNLLQNKAFLGGQVHTTFVDDNIALLVDETFEQPRNRFLDQMPGVGAVDSSTNVAPGLAGAQVDANDPLALLNHRDYNAARAENKYNSIDPVAHSLGGMVTKRLDGELGSAELSGANFQGPPGTTAVVGPIQGKVFKMLVEEGQEVRRGETVAVLEAMKMEHDIKSTSAGIVREVSMGVGDVVREGFPLMFIEEADVQVDVEGGEDEIDLDYIRPDLELVNERHEIGWDENRPNDVARRRRFDQRTARENIFDLCDDGTFVEYGPLVVARQRRRQTEEWLREHSAGDGMVCGVGTVNGDKFEDVRSRAILLAYDYTVFAGTQGGANHYKQDRMFQLAKRFRMPLVIYTEGGGGRPGDTDGPGGVGMDTMTFTEFSMLSGLVPLVGITSGRCFAGNTALLACCDVIIATANSTIAMGGPAMIEGGGLGVYTPEEVGPLSFQVPNGVVDILVADEAEATAVAKKYLSYFQGPVDTWEVPDQRKLRHIVPESRTKMYDMRELISTLCDVDSVLEIRPEFGVGIITCLVRVEGVPMGLIANNPHHFAGAIDSPASDKAARFLQLLDAFDLPCISLMDCPGMMVGPEVESTGLVRHCARLFNTGANVTIPMFALVIRKAYGLGVQAMCGGSSQVPFSCATWPTGEFAGMGIEGSIKLGQRKQLEAIEDPEERLALYNRLVDASYERAMAVYAVTNFGIDDVIDPSSSRTWLTSGVRSLPPDMEPAGWFKRTGKKRPNIDTW